MSRRGSGRRVVAPQGGDLGARLLRPNRTRLAEARAAVAGIDDAAAAWAALAARGVIPAAWAASELRGFGMADWHYRDEGEAAWHRLAVDESDPLADLVRMAPPPATMRLPARRWRRGLVHPPTVTACVAIASDPAGIAVAEALALEAGRRCFRALGAAIVWRVVGPAEVERIRARPVSALRPHDEALLETGYFCEVASADALVLVAPEAPADGRGHASSR